MMFWILDGWIDVCFEFVDMVEVVCVFQYWWFCECIVYVEVVLDYYQCNYEVDEYVEYFFVWWLDIDVCEYVCVDQCE